MGRIKQFLYTTILFNSLLFAQGEWIWQNPQPQGNGLYAIHVFGNGDIIAAGDYGTLIRSSDSGLNWDVQHYAFAPGDPQITHMQFVDDNTGWLVEEHHLTSYKELYYTNDGGQTWEQRNIPSGLVGDFFALDAQTAWITTGVSASISRTTDGGFTWTKYDIASNQDFTAAGIFFLDQYRGWVVGYDLVGSKDYGKIYYTIDGGVTWSERYTNPEEDTALGQVFFVNDTTGWIGGVDGLIMGTTDGGQTWTTQFHRPNTNYAVLDILFYDENKGVAVGTDDRMLIGGVYVDRALVVTTTDGGQTWELRDSAADMWIRDIYAISDSTIWGCGPGGWLIRSEDRGHTWAPVSKGATRALLNCVTFSDEMTGWTGGGADGVLLKTEDGGQNWFIADSGEHLITILQFLDPLNGFRIEWYGQTYRTRDGGNSWELTDVLGRDGLFQNGFFADTTRGWLSWNYLGDGYIKQTNDGGQSWQIVLSTPDIWLWEIEFVNASTGWVCGGHNVTIPNQQGYIYKTTDGGTTWLLQTSVSEPLYEIDFIDENTGWCVGAWGTMLATTDGGNTWNPVNIPFSETLTDVYFQDENSGWIIGNDGVGRTFDGGQTWETFSMPHGQGFIYGAAFFSGMDEGWLVGALGHILKFDGSATPIAEDDAPMQVPSTAELYQNYPNPFNPETAIRFQLSAVDQVRLEIYNLLGQKIKTLLNKQMSPGSYELHWNGTDDSGRQVSSGVYLYRLITGEFSQVRKMMQMR